ncbi:MAG TPA: tripartite tricarboxylate transporter substrate-binding protein [Ramlibacter sp.]|nr:tripartite tricarboxylate transporter substrate-binding protein [Ramlibacter sp.]
MFQRRILVAAALAALAVAAPVASAADAYPSRPVRLVVPSSVGGGADAIARVLSASLQQAWPHGVAVENRTGAGGAIGTLEVVRAQPDGHTLLVQNSSMVTNNAIAAKKPYDPAKDLTPIMLVGVTPLAVFAHAGAPFASLRELTEAARAKAGALSYGSCGNGTPHHFGMELLKQKLNIDVQHVGYKGCAPAITDVVGGQLPIGIVTANMIAPHVAAGRVKVLAVSGARRYRLLPDAPTLDSLGHGSPDFSIWYALMGPPRMPPQLVSQIADKVQKVLDTPAVQGQLAAAGVEPLRGGAGELARLIRNESEQYARIARQAGIQAD